MATVKGKVQYDPRPNKGGYYSIKVNDAYYGCGKSDPGVRKGDMVEFEAEQNGEYQNVKQGSLKKEANAGGSAPANSNGSPRSSGGSSEKVFPVPPRHGDRAFIRKDAVATATQLVLRTGADLISGDLNTTANEIIRVAKIFEAYQAGDEERRQDEAKAAQRVAQQITGGGE